jgi:hypothetical protein
MSRKKKHLRLVFEEMKPVIFHFNHQKQLAFSLL